jgi:hypothetical protein
VTRAQRSFRRLLPAFPQASKSRAAARQVTTPGRDAAESCGRAGRQGGLRRPVQ